MTLMELVLSMDSPIVKLSVRGNDPPAQRWYHTGMLYIREECCFLTDILARGSERSATPMPGVTLKSPIKDLVPIELEAGPSQDKGKGQAMSLTVSEFKGAWHGGESSSFIYNWIDDEHGDSDPEGPRESDWMTDRSYFDASDEPLKWL
jgi:hypothetical protein